jgi:hypothetical protein
VPPAAAAAPPAARVRLLRAGPLPAAVSGSVSPAACCQPAGRGEGGGQPGEGVMWAIETHVRNCC